MGTSRSLMKRKVIMRVRSEKRYIHTYAAHTAPHQNTLLILLLADYSVPVAVQYRLEINPYNVR